MYSPLGKSPSKPLRFCVLPPWKIPIKTPSVLCTPPFEKTPIKTPSVLCTPPFEKSLFFINISNEKVWTSLVNGRKFCLNWKAWRGNWTVLRKMVFFAGFSYWGKKVLESTADFRTHLWKGHYAYTKIVNSESQISTRSFRRNSKIEKKIARGPFWSWKRTKFRDGFLNRRFHCKNILLLIFE